MHRRSCGIGNRRPLPTILGGVIAWPAAQARDVLRFYAEFTQTAPDELNIDPNIVWGPGGQPLVMLEVCWSADKAMGERVLQPLRSFGHPVFDKIGAMPYVALQSGGDDNNAAGRRSYSKSGFFTRMTPAAIDTIVEVFESAAPDRVNIIMQQGGGAIGRKPVNFAAFPNCTGSADIPAAGRFVAAACGGNWNKC